MKKTILGLFSLAMVLVSCGGESPKKEETKEEKKPLNCYYSYDASSTEMNWTAFKFLRKAPVGGTFDKISVDGPEKSADLNALLSKLSFTIPTNTVNSNNPERDKKIDSLFFGAMETTTAITGKVVSLGENGKAVLEINMNNVSKDVEVDYSLNGEVFTFNTTVDMNDWNGQKAVASLNEACKDLHTDVENGDTESKLWSEVEITFSTQFKKDCE